MAEQDEQHEAEISLEVVESSALRLFDEYLKVREAENDGTEEFKKLDNLAHLLRVFAGLLDARTIDGFYSQTTRTSSKAILDSVEGWLASYSDYLTRYYANVEIVDSQQEFDSKKQFHPSPEGTNLVYFALSKSAGEKLRELDVTDLENGSAKKPFVSRYGFVETRIQTLKVVIAELETLKLDEDASNKFPKCAEVIEKAVKLVNKIDTVEVENKLRKERKAMFDDLVAVYEQIGNELSGLEFETYTKEGDKFDTKLRKNALKEVREKLTNEMRQFRFQEMDIDKLTGRDMIDFLKSCDWLRRLREDEYNSEEVVFGRPVLDDLGLVDVSVVPGSDGKVVVEITVSADYLDVKKKKGDIAPHARIVKAGEPTLRKLEVDMDLTLKGKKLLALPDGDENAPPGIYKAELREDKEGKWFLFILTDKYIDRLNAELNERKKESSELAEKFGWALPIEEMNIRHRGNLSEDNIRSLSREYMAVGCDTNGAPCGEDDPNLDHFRIYKRVPLHKYKPGVTIWVHDSSTSNCGRYKSAAGCAGAVIFGYGRSANWRDWNEYVPE